MGRASRAKQKPDHLSGLAPGAKRVRLDELAYTKLRLAIRDADAVVAECQARVSSAIATRDAAVKAVTDQHGIELKPGTQIQWDDDKKEFAFS
jgi:hypothetical protein